MVHQTREKTENNFGWSGSDCDITEVIHNLIRSSASVDRCCPAEVQPSYFRRDFHRGPGTVHYHNILRPVEPNFLICRYMIHLSFDLQKLIE